MSTFNLGIRAHDLVASTPAELVTKLKTYQLKNIHFAPKKSFPNLVPDLSKLTEETARFLGDTFAQEEVKLSVLGCYVNISSRDKKFGNRQLTNSSTTCNWQQPFMHLWLGQKPVVSHKAIL